VGGPSFLGNLEEGLSTGDFELDEGALGMGHRSLKGLRGGGPQGGPLKDEVFERHANALWAGLPFGEPGGGLVYQGL